MQRYKEIKLKDFSRKDSFKNYIKRDCPLVKIVSEVDVTNIVSQTKIHKNFYAAMAYCVMHAMNNVEEFKYRLIKRKIVKVEDAAANMVQLLKNDNISFITVPYSNNYNEFVDNYKKSCANLGNKFVKKEKIKYDEIWMSCYPWGKFTDLSTPYNNDFSIPQAIWDKFEKRDGKVKINMMIMASHAFVDGLHLAKFFKEFEKEQIAFKIEKNS